MTFQISMGSGSGLLVCPTASVGFSPESEPEKRLHDGIAFIGKAGENFSRLAFDQYL